VRAGIHLASPARRPGRPRIGRRLIRLPAGTIGIAPGSRKNLRETGRCRLWVDEPQPAMAIVACRRAELTGPGA
jgi:hypothetical protein